MSIRVMTWLWELPLQPTDKLVLLALADSANDEGLCWPSIATVARKSGVSERSVQRAIRHAEASKLLVRQEVRGKGCKYTFDRRQPVTPDTVSPVTNETSTPDTVSPKPSRTINPSEAKASSGKRAAPVRSIERPHDVTSEVWADFQIHRKQKGSPIITQTALDGIRREADRVGWSLNDALAECCLRGWVGFKADWIKDGNNGRNGTHGLGRNQPTGHSPALGIGRTGRASLAVAEQLRAAGHNI